MINSFFLVCDGFIWQGKSLQINLTICYRCAIIKRIKEYIRQKGKTMKKLLALIMILSSLCPQAMAAGIHAYREEIPISESITLTKVEEFYADKNLSYSYITADLTDEHTSLKLLTSSEGTDILDTVGNLAATDETAVAALNADFFSIFSGKKGFSLGIEIKDGELLQSPINPATMATVAYQDDSVLMSYLDFHIMAVAPNGQYHEVRHLNKHTSYFGDILMYTKEFNNGMSPAPGGEVCEVVVEDGKIKEFRRSLPAVEIPENGCVLVVSEGINMFLANNFQVGDEIRFDYYFTPDIREAETAFGGGAMLVKDGQAVTQYSHTVNGTHPRSAIGVDKNGTTLYLVAVNGRQEASKGMTMQELSELMLSLGCYQAVNLDGGGSTNMVASTVWNGAMHTVNSPSENRKVVNAVGLTYTQAGDKPTGILLEADQPAVFIGQPVTITAAAHDQFMRPIAGEIGLSSKSGSFDGNTFVPNQGGVAVIEAVCGMASAELEIFVVDTVSGIEVDSYIALQEGESASLGLCVFDDAGHDVAVTNTEVFEITSSNPAVASVSGQTVQAHKNGTAIITVKKDAATSYASVTVGGAPEIYTERFEELSGKFKAYPADGVGAFSLSSEQVYTGVTSGKLSYDFTKKPQEPTAEAELVVTEPDVARGAYFSLFEDKQLAGTCREISLYCYTPTDFAHELRAQFIDGNGKIFITSFGKNLQTATWQKLTAQIPDTAVRPLKLDSIYVLYQPGDVQDAGAVYLDDLSFEISKPAKFEAAEMNQYAEGTDSIKGQFWLGALSQNTKTLLARKVNARMQETIEYAPAGFILGEWDGFSYYEDYNADFLCLQLNTSKGGIRATDASQWNQIANAIWASDKNNVFILSEDSIFGKSAFENQVLKDYLSALDKNIYVVTGGERNTYKNINGVHYFTIGTGDEIISMTHLDSYRCLAFDFGEEITFGWKKIF
ncbi:MAG: hypothetical protein E7397_07820 [Ruminococcaceae bacterium]|nr:hypothetical protein [Oscillospiraceae bacterium]